MGNAGQELNIDVAKTLGIGTYSRKRTLRRIVLSLVALALLSGGVYALVSGNRTSAVRYETQPVTRGDLVVTVNATGTLEPIKEVEVGIEVSGTVKSVEVDFNDRVTAGQVLARLDTSKLEAQTLQSEAALKSAEAKLLQAQATVKEAKAQMARLTELHALSGGKTPSRYDLDTQEATLERARADESGAKASVDQAQATLDANQTDLRKAVVHSPIDGIVLDRAIEPGQTVAAEFESPLLFTLAEDLAKMELRVDVDEADVGRVREGQEAIFTVDAYPDQTFPAKTTQVRYGSESVDGVVTYKAVLDVDNSELILRPGMTATATITVDKREDALLLPNAALRFTPPKTDNGRRGGDGSFLGKILPRPPMPESNVSADPNASKKEQPVWTLRDGHLVAIDIEKGLSDGVHTELLRGEIKDGTELVTDQVGTES